MTDIRRSLLILALLAVAACERTKSVPAVESTKPIAGATTELPAPAELATWDKALGPVLLIGGTTATTAEVLTETGLDSTRLPGTKVLLLGRGGETQQASLTLTTPPQEDACKGLGAWQLAAASGALNPWSVGFSAQEEVDPLPMDSVESLSSADSASIAAQMARLASTSPSAESKRFAGLPFSVLSLWRFSPAPGVTAIAANLIRKLSMEASPQEERTTIIAEKDSTSSNYALAYEERSQGNEETVESRDFVAAVRLGAGHTPILVMTHDYEAEIAYSILEREGRARWKVRWTSRRVKC